MNSNEIALALGPCADYEFDLVEMREGTLEPDRAGTARAASQHGLPGGAQAGLRNRPAQLRCADALGDGAVLPQSAFGGSSLSRLCAPDDR